MSDMKLIMESWRGYVNNLENLMNENLSKLEGDDKVYLFDKNSSTPIWSYSTNGHVSRVDISADGKYIVAGGSDNYIYLFHRDSNTPLWSYDAEDNVGSVSISSRLTS